jgi:hypothetical protein
MQAWSAEFWLIMMIQSMTDSVSHHYVEDSSKEREHLKTDHTFPEEGHLTLAFLFSLGYADLRRGLRYLL